MSGVAPPCEWLDLCGLTETKYNKHLLYSNGRAHYCDRDRDVWETRQSSAVSEIDVVQIEHEADNHLHSLWIGTAMSIPVWRRRFGCKISLVQPVSSYPSDYSAPGVLGDSRWKRPSLTGGLHESLPETEGCLETHWQVLAPFKGTDVESTLT